MERAARAPTDGYTIAGVNDGSLVMTPHLYKKVNYDPVNGFEPVSLLAQINWVLIANPSMPKTVKDFIALAKARPGDIDYASGGNGSPAHLAAEAFRLAAGIDYTHVPYKGAPEIVRALLGGQVQAGFPTFDAAYGQAKQGLLRPLAVTGEQRSRALPDVPTLHETVMPDFDLIAWAGLFGPAKMPPDVIKTLSDELGKVLADPEVKARYNTFAFEALNWSPDEIRKQADIKNKIYGKLVARKNISLE